MAVLAHMSAAASACPADSEFTGLNYADGFEAAAGRPGEDGRRALLAHIVERAATLVSERGETLLPRGTTLDGFHLDQRNTLHVRLTMPVDGGVLPLDDLRAETIEHVLSIPFIEDPTYTGVVARVRMGSGDVYRLLGDHVAGSVEDDVAPALQDVREETAAAHVPRAMPEGESWQLEPHGLGGPVANADGQPVGALSGVVVFVNAGHGWTAGSSSWFLQRPLLLNMNEDYGNIDQLNYFVQYLYNAGATVVPFRPVGYQSIEIVLDNDDPGVTYTGAWNNSVATTEYYENGVTVSGVPYRWASTNASTETAVARYTPNIPVADFYPVYCWTRDGTDRTNQLYRIRHSGGTAEVRVDHRRVGKGWIWLGTHYFEAGTGGYVEISNLAPSGVVIADAIRFGSGMGDIVRPGPGRVSGYPRDEEAARYWAHSEAGNNAVGLPSSIWNCCETDQSDNVGTAARWARHMNRENVNSERWRRVYIEYHSNAAGSSCGTPPCNAKGTVCLVNTANPTTNQTTFASVLCDKIEADMLAIHDQFEFTWGVRSNPATGSFGAISTNNNSNQFDATIIEVAFHDNAQDAANLRNAKVRDAVARSSLQGLIMFLSNAGTYPGTQVPNVFLPDPPERLRATHDGSGNVVLSWVAGPARPANPASGDPPTGYRIYRSTNGYGFGQGLDVGNVLSATLTDVPANTTTYFRVAAYNAGGESMPTETLAVRRVDGGPSYVLIVNGYDRVSRHLNHIQQIPAGPMERPIPRIVNSFDYIVQHARALEATGLPFDSCSNEAVIAGTVSLNNYAAVIWILGRESQQDKTFDSTEQTLVTSYLNAGGGLFVTGTDIGFELDGLGTGQSFYRNVLRGLYAGDDANTFNVVGSGGSMSGLSQFNFSIAGGAPYRAAFPDQLNPNTGATGILSYVGGAGGGAGIEYDSGTYRMIMFGFPFETIGSAVVREQVMSRVMSFLLPGGVGCLTATLSNFEGYASGTQVMFRPPNWSGSTAHHLAAGPDSAVVTDEAAFDGTRSCKVQWQWLDTSPSRWLRLTTSNADNVPNPAIDLRRAVRLRLRLDAGQFRLALGIRETGADVSIGDDGGNTGTIEWVGATSTINGSAPQGVLITAQPGVWQTITFVPNPATTLPFTGDGFLEAPNNMGVLEHLAFTITNDAGPFTVYLDAIQQPCPPRADLDGDGDVDQDDFAILQRCLTGPFVPQNDPDCLRARLDGDSDVDQDDFTILFNCLSGPGIPADPDCGS